MLVNLPYAYDDLFLPRMGSLTFAGRPCSTPAGGGVGVGGMLPLYWEAPPKRGMVNSGETDTRLILVVA